MPVLRAINAKLYVKMKKYETKLCFNCTQQSLTFTFRIKAFKKFI